MGASVIALAAAIGWWASPRSAASPAAGTSQGMGQRASIDPATGQLRPVEHDDIQQALTLAAEDAAPTPRLGASGGVVVTIPEALQTFSVATLAPDGKVSIEHVTGPRNATIAAGAGAASGRKAGATERLNEK